jgi:hypothetical protein
MTMRVPDPVVMSFDVRDDDERWPIYWPPRVSLTRRVWDRAANALAWVDWVNVAVWLVAILSGVVICGLLMAFGAWWAFVLPAAIVSLLLFAHKAGERR